MGSAGPSEPPDKENFIILTFSTNFSSDSETSFPTTNLCVVHTGDKLSLESMLQWGAGMALYLMWARGKRFHLNTLS